MNQSPKQRFLEQTALAKQFLDVVYSEAFNRACELAMLVLIQEQNGKDDAAGFQRIKGAERFIEVLRALPEPSKPVASKPSYNLVHDLK